MKKPIKIASRKAKARELQNWIAEQISKLLNIPYGPDELIAPREMGQNGCDVRLIGKAKKKFPYSVECKRTEKLNIYQAIEQAKTNQMKDTDWLVCFRRNRDSPKIVIEAETFFKLLKEKKDAKD